MTAPDISLIYGTAAFVNTASFAAASHGHAQSDVTNLVSDLAGKAATGHAHAASDITSGQFAMARLASGTPDGTKFIRDDGTLVTPSAGGVSDGDKGDITVSASGATWTIDAGAVGTSKLGGDITTAGKALLDDADAAAQRTTLGLGSFATVTPTGTPDGTKYLRDDNSWQAVSGGSGLTHPQVLARVSFGI